MHERIHQLPFDFSRLLEGNFIFTVATAFRRALWDEVGRYDERFPVYGSLGASFVMNGGPICYKQAGSIDEVITRAGHFIPTARGLLPNRSISSRVSPHAKPSRLQSHSVAK
jgi:hypothetical protein